MAKKAKQSVQVPVLSGFDETNDAILDEELDDEERDAVAAMLELQGAQTATWSVYRLPPSHDPKNKPIGFCDTLVSSELSNKEIQTRFGRGKYRIQGFRADRTFLKSITITIATDPPTPPAQPAGGAAATDIVSLLNARDEKSAKRLDVALSLGIPALTAVITAWIASSRGNDRNSTKDAVELLAGLKAITPEPPKQTDTTEVLLKALDFFRESSDKGKDGSNWLDLARDGLSQIGNLIAGKAQAPATRPMQLLSRPDQNTPGQPVLYDGESQMRNMVSWAQKTLAYLIKKASKNADTSLYADLLLDEVPDGVDIGQFIQYLNAPSWWQTLQQFDKNVAPYEGWFASFRDDLIASYEEQVGPLTPETKEPAAQSPPSTETPQPPEVA